MTKHTQISDWVEEDGYAFRYLLGKDPENPENRVAFIEKTPRVRIRPAGMIEIPDCFNWCEGLKGTGPNDKESRDWCDAMLDLVYNY